MVKKMGSFFFVLKNKIFIPFIDSLIIIFECYLNNCQIRFIWHVWVELGSINCISFETFETFDSSNNFFLY